MTRNEQIDIASLDWWLNKVNQNGDAEMAFKAGAAWADENPQNHWISVEDALPPKESEYEDNSIVVLATDGNNVYKGLYRSGEYLSGWFTCDLWELDDITHWQYLPQPPSSSEKPNYLKKGGEQ